jgi:hypothetical protein
VVFLSPSSQILSGLGAPETKPNNQVSFTYKWVSVRTVQQVTNLRYIPVFFLGISGSVTYI